MSCEWTVFANAGQRLPPAHLCTGLKGNDTCVVISAPICKMYDYLIYEHIEQFDFRIKLYFPFVASAANLLDTSSLPAMIVRGIKTRYSAGEYTALVLVLGHNDDDVIQKWKDHEQELLDSIQNSYPDFFKYKKNIIAECFHASTTKEDADDCRAYFFEM